MQEQWSLRRTIATWTLIYFFIYTLSIIFLFISKLLFARIDDTIAIKQTVFFWEYTRLHFYGVPWVRQYGIAHAEEKGIIVLEIIKQLTHVSLILKTYSKIWTFSLQWVNELKTTSCFPRSFGVLEAIWWFTLPKNGQITAKMTGHFDGDKILSHQKT